MVGAVLTLGVPGEFVVGIDLIAIARRAPQEGADPDGSRVDGFRNVPFGLHLVSYAARDSEHGAAAGIRNGIWVMVDHARPQPELWWDCASETLRPRPDSAAPTGVVANLNLVPYPLRRDTARGSGDDDDSDDGDGDPLDNTVWPHLSGHVTEELLRRVFHRMPPHLGWALDSASDANIDAEEDVRLPKGHDEPAIQWAEFDTNRSFAPGATGATLTQQMMDKSWLLQDMVTRTCNGDAMQVVGEVQLSFLTLLLVSNYSGALQWRRLVRLLAQSIRAMDQMPSLYMEFLGMFCIPSQHASPDLTRYRSDRESGRRVSAPCVSRRVAGSRLYAGRHGPNDTQCRGFGYAEPELIRIPLVPTADAADSIAPSALWSCFQSDIGRATG